MVSPAPARHTLVTGGASGIGRATAAELTSLGSRVVIADCDEEQLALTGDELGVETAYVDLNDPASISRLVADTDECQVLVSCAGIARVDRFLESDPADWDRMYQVNQRGPMQLTQLVLPSMIAAGFGRLVFVSSDGARAGASGEAAYAATKASLFGFAKSVARETALLGVTANVVCPGPTRTPMIDRSMAEHPEMLERIERGIPMKRLGEPDEQAAAIAWLVSPRASYVTGQVISVSGGITMH